ncbi:MAG: WD40 repeat domain-containing protein [Myxococcales bacterium]|nr:WD40 repeat domain-containing protein [Myxococcales bacterium]
MRLTGSRAATTAGWGAALGAALWACACDPAPPRDPTSEPGAAPGAAPRQGRVDGCRAARAAQATARALLDGGRLLRAVAMLDESARACPEELPAALELVAAAQSALATPPPEPEPLLAEGLRLAVEGRGARAEGRAAAADSLDAAAQRSLDRALVRLERREGSVARLDVPRGQEALRVLAPWPARHANAVAWTPAGELFVASGEHAYVVDPHTGGVTLRLGRPDGAPVIAVAASPSGVLATGTYELVELWDGRSGAALGALRAHPGELVRALAFSPDGGRVASASVGFVAVWDVPEQRLVATFGAPVLRDERERDAFTLVAFARGGGAILAADAERHRVWELDGGAELTPEHAPPGSVGESVALARGGDLVVRRTSLGQSGWGLELVDARTGKVRGTWEGDAGPAVFSPNDRVVATAEGLYDAATGRRLHTYPRGAAPAAFSPDGALLAVVDVDGAVSIVDAESRSPAGRVDALVPTDGVAALTLSAGGTALAVAGAAGTAVWDLATGSLRHPRCAPGVTSLALSADGGRLACANADGVTVADLVADGPLVHVPLPAPRAAPVLEVAPDGSWLLAWSAGVLRLVAVPSAATLGERGGGTEPVMDFATSADGAWLATRTARGIDVWALPTLALVQQIEAPLDTGRGTGRSVALGPDGAWLAYLGTERRLVHLLRREQGVFHEAQRGTSSAAPVPEQRAAPVDWLAFAARGARLVAVGTGGVVAWDLNGGSSLRRRYFAGRVPVDAARLSPDGRSLVLLQHGEIRLYAIDTENVRATARFTGGFEGAYLLTTDGLLEPAGRLPSEPVCQVGAKAYPFALCRDRCEWQGLFAWLLDDARARPR